MRNCFFAWYSLFQPSSLFSFENLLSVVLVIQVVAHFGGIFIRLRFYFSFFRINSYNCFCCMEVAFTHALLFWHDICCGPVSVCLHKLCSFKTDEEVELVCGSHKRFPWLILHKGIQVSPEMFFPLLLFLKLRTWKNSSMVHQPLRMVLT